MSSLTGKVAITLATPTSQLHRGASVDRLTFRTRWGSVANKADVTRLFDETEQQLGSIDIVVNVAGVSVFKPHWPKKVASYYQPIAKIGQKFLLGRFGKSVDSAR
jgi:NAD(P)-dependent dehydrogenase (short-subunit alcohol dehydrogenase family)